MQSNKDLRSEKKSEDSNKGHHIKASTALCNTIRSKNTEPSGPKAESKGSMLLKLAAATLNNINWRRNCEICEELTEIKQNIFIADCEHKKSFCQSCLQHYAIYVIQNQFSKVRCPASSCKSEMQVDGHFFTLLPVNIQAKYRKIHQFYSVMEDPNIKMCPKDGCDGLARVQEGSTRTKCQGCSRQFCSKCFLEFHEGECAQLELQFFQKNLHYRQCPRCKTVIDRFDGCNHMTCPCKHQFCYICKADWNEDHYRNHDANGVFIPPPQPENPNENERCYSRGWGYWLTFPLRIIVALVLFGIILSLLGLVVGFFFLELLCSFSMGSSFRLCQNYFQLYACVFTTIF